MKKFKFFVNNKKYSEVQINNVPQHIQLFYNNYHKFYGYEVQYYICNILFNFITSQDDVFSIEKEKMFQCTNINNVKFFIKNLNKLSLTSEYIYVELVYHPENQNYYEMKFITNITYTMLQDLEIKLFTDMDYWNRISVSS